MPLKRKHFQVFKEVIMTLKNTITLSMLSTSENVSVARVTAAAFAAQADLTLNEIEEVKVAISEAITNAVVHGYKEEKGQIELNINLYETLLEFIVTDHGTGIENILEARKPSFSTDPERMGLGFVFMESFMDVLEVESELGKGTRVRMVKKFGINGSH